MLVDTHCLAGAMQSILKQWDFPPSCTSAQGFTPVGGIHMVTRCCRIVWSRCGDTQHKERQSRSRVARVRERLTFCNSGGDTGVCHQKNTPTRHPPPATRNQQPATSNQRPMMRFIQILCYAIPVTPLHSQFRGYRSWSCCIRCMRKDRGSNCEHRGRTEER